MPSLDLQLRWRYGVGHALVWQIVIGTQVDAEAAIEFPLGTCGPGRTGVLPLDFGEHAAGAIDVRLGFFGANGFYRANVPMP